MWWIEDLAAGAAPAASCSRQGHERPITVREQERMTNIPSASLCTARTEDLCMLPHISGCQGQTVLA